MSLLKNGISDGSGRSLKNIQRGFGWKLVVCLLIVSGCATTRQSGIDTANKHVDKIERIASQRFMNDFSKFDGVGLISLGKAGALGLGGVGWKGTIFVRDPETGRFGPPSFIGSGGFSVGLIYAGITAVDCLLLFLNREDAIDFAKRKTNINFTNEATFGIWGRKQMTTSKGQFFSDGAGLSVGAIELEFLFGGPLDKLHKNLYHDSVTVEQILNGDVAVPKDIADVLERLNLLMVN